MTGSDAERPGRTPTRTIFFGSGDFALPTLEMLVGLPDTMVVGVISTPDRPAGRSAGLRPTPVSARARDLGLPLLQPERLRSAEVAADIGALAADLGVLADYGRIVPPAILGLPRLGIVNVHPSLLPRHRGAAPIPATILAGDETAGVTIILMDEGLDTGPVLAARRWRLRGDETTPELEAEAARVGAELLAESLPDWIAGRSRPIPQATSGATLTRPLVREDGRLDPMRPAAQLERMVRGLQPWPGTYLELEGGRLIVRAATVTDGRSEDRPGRLVGEGRGIALATASGRLCLDVVQPQGGQPMSGEAYRRGRGRRLVDPASS